MRAWAGFAQVFRPASSWRSVFSFGTPGQPIESRSCRRELRISVESFPELIGCFRSFLLFDEHQSQIVMRRGELRPQSNRFPQRIGGAAQIPTLKTNTAQGAVCIRGIRINTRSRA